jgi:hypothetical protein
MNWQDLQVAPGGTHHIDEHGRPAYGERFIFRTFGFFEALPAAVAPDGWQHLTIWRSDGVAHDEQHDARLECCDFGAQSFVEIWNDDAHGDIVATYRDYARSLNSNMRIPAGGDE